MWSQLAEATCERASSSLSVSLSWSSTLLVPVAGRAGQMAEIVASSSTFFLLGTACSGGATLSAGLISLGALTAEIEGP